MYLNSEEDEKTTDPFTYDERVMNTSRKIFEYKNEDIMNVFSSQFIDFILVS